jgi:hypothetical protein
MLAPIKPETMRKITILFILALFSLFLSAQTKVEKTNKLIISYNGDSTLLTEKYEINIVKKKIFYITPIMNYLDIKGTKYRTRKKISKKDWVELYSLIDNLNLSEFYQNNENQDEVIYSIEFLKKTNEIKVYYFNNLNVPSELKKIFEIIRN